MATLTPVDSDPQACRGGHAVPGAAGWLTLAAAPTFGLMALWSGLSGGPADVDVLCASMQQSASPLDGMTLMYALMSVFHSAAWLKPISSLLQNLRSAPVRCMEVRSYMEVHRDHHHPFQPRAEP